MDTRQFHKQLFEATRQHIPTGSGVVCAVSGGADSMALLHGLHNVNRMRHRNWRLLAAHLDHGLPHDSAMMRDFVHQTAQSLALPCISDRVDVPARSKETGESIEEAGRKARYAFLEQAALQADAAVVVLAHHADDQAETVLHRILRGTGLRGLAGIPMHRPIREGSEIMIIRPLLTVRRHECRSYLQRRGLHFMEDETNQDVGAATRNRIRHELLPLIRHSINPQIASALVRLAQQAGRQSEAMQVWAAEALAECLIDAKNPSQSCGTGFQPVEPTGETPVPQLDCGQRLRRATGGFAMGDKECELCLCANTFSNLPQAVQTEVVRLALMRLDIGLKEIDFERIEAAADAGRGSGALRRIELPGGLIVERRGKRLRFITHPLESSKRTDANPTQSQARL